MVRSGRRPASRTMRLSAVIRASRNFAVECVLKRLDLSVTYAIWSDVGTALAALIGVAYFREPLSLFKLASLALVVLGVIGLPLAAKETH